MSSHAQIFKAPGEAGAKFLLSLFDLTPSEIPHEVYLLGSVVLALYFWLIVLKIAIRILARLTGFEERRPRS